MGMNLGAAPGDEPEVMMEMNATPLIDVMMVLLIMLIITIPAQLHSVNLDMPVATSTPPKRDPVVIQIEVNAANVVLWNGKPLADRVELDAKLAQAAAAQPQPQLHIRSHAKSKYGVTAGIMASAQRSGLTQLGMVGSERFAN